MELWFYHFLFLVLVENISLKFIDSVYLLGHDFIIVIVFPCFSSLQIPAAGSTAMQYSILQLWDISVWFFCWISACSLSSWFSSVELKRRSNWEPREKLVFKTSEVLLALHFYWELLGALPSLPGDQWMSPLCISLPSLTPYKVSSTTLNMNWMIPVEYKNITATWVSAKWLVYRLKIYLLQKRFIAEN